MAPMAFFSFQSSPQNETQWVCSDQLNDKMGACPPGPVKADQAEEDSAWTINDKKELLCGSVMSPTHSCYHTDPPTCTIPLISHLPPTLPGAACVCHVQPAAYSFWRRHPSPGKHITPLEYSFQWCYALLELDY